MLGTIRTADVLAHPLLVARLFGLATLARCLAAIVTHKRCTFLEQLR